MASSRLARKLYYVAHCMPSFKRQAVATAIKGKDAAVCEAAGQSVKDSSPWCHKRRTMASAAQEITPEETGFEHGRHGHGHAHGPHYGRGALFRGRRGQSPFDLFESFFPNRNLRFMIDRMGRVFDDPIFARSWMVPGGQSEGHSRPPWDFVETEEAFKMRMDVPGLSKEEVKVYVEDGSLVIKGEHAEENKADEAQWASRSQASHYSTRIVLPENVNAEMIKAELKNGVLSVSIPKVAEEEPKKTVIDVKIE